MSLTISCDDCAMCGTAACGDCVVTYLCNLDDTKSVVIDAAEVDAVRLLHRAGLAPDLRYRRRAC